VINSKLDTHKGRLDDHDVGLTKKSTDRILGDYFELIAATIGKDYGVKETKYKLNDPKFMTPDFDLPEA
jgi:hypothetical protein